MKNLSVFTVVAAFAAVLTSNVNAAEPLLSPRAKANQMVTVSGVTEDKLDRAIQPGTPKGRELAYSLRKVPSTGPSIDLVRENRGITASPKALANYPQMFKPAMKPATAIAACCKTMTKAECGMACCKDTSPKCGGTCCKS